MSIEGPLTNLRKNSTIALEDSRLRNALKTATDMFAAKRDYGLSSIPFEEWRLRASLIRDHVLENLEELVNEFTFKATQAGAVTHRAKDADQAAQLILDLLKDNGVRKLVKAKSMVSEEIHLNHILESHGIRVVETDLGEYIVQLAGETPSHILAPAIHKNRSQVGRLFSQKLGVEYSEDPEILTKIARGALRREFETADAGFSGVNFAVSSSGSIAIFTNEGNGRMCTTVPPLHIALLTIEKMLPTLADLALFTKLLPRSATGQFLSSYVSIITGTRKTGESTGARRLHIVLLDNGRSQILQSPFREILKCIRCSSCMNVCPVYRVIGGHAYESTYSGPMGVVLTNLLEGLEKAHPLLDASTLCGACDEICPVMIPLSRLISRLREKHVATNMIPSLESILISYFGSVVRHPMLFGISQKIARKTLPIAKQLSKKVRLDRLPSISQRTFRELKS